jgi:tetratricopeptide (TPR) repeat protein
MLVVLVLAPSVSSQQALIAGVPYLSWQDFGQWQAPLVLTILRYWGRDATPESAMRALGGSPTATIAPERLVSYFAGSGLRTESGENATLETLKSLVARRIPVIVLQLIAPVGAEREYFPFRVVIGYDETTDRIAVHDSDPALGWAWPISRADFLAMWSTPRWPRWYVAAYPTDYEAILRTKPSPTPYPARTPDHEVNVMRYFAFYVGRAGRLDDAERMYRQAVALPGASAGALSPVYNNLAAILNARGRHDEAITAAQKAIELRPDFANPHKQLGDAYYGLCKSRKELTLRLAAIEAYQRAIALNSQYDAAKQALEEAQRNTDCR